MAGNQSLKRPDRFFELVFLDGEIERHALSAEDVVSGPKGDFSADQVWAHLRNRLHRSGPWRGPKPTVREISSEDYRND